MLHTSGVDDAPIGLRRRGDQLLRLRGRGETPTLHHRLPPACIASGQGKQVHLIDSPGYPDFIGNALSALAAVENVVLISVSATSGIEVNTRRIVQSRPPG